MAGESKSGQDAADVSISQERHINATRSGTVSSTFDEAEILYAILTITATQHYCAKNTCIGTRSFFNPKMPTLTPLKCYTMSRRPLMYQDLHIRDDSGQPVFAVAFSSTGNIRDTARAVRIHEKSLNYGVVCVAIAKKERGLEVRLPGSWAEHKHRKYRVECCRGGDGWQDEFGLTLDNGEGVRWKRTENEEIWVPERGAANEARMLRTMDGDWKLVATRIAIGPEEEEPTREEILAVYVQTRSGKNLQKATMYFFAALSSELEVASLAAILGLDKWFIKASSTQGKTQRGGRFRQNDTLSYV